MSARPLVITSEPQLLDDLLRIAAGAGVEVEHAADAGAVRQSWAAAPAVVVGADAAASCARLQLPRRPGVVLLGIDLDDAGVWQIAVEVGAEHVVFLPDGEVWLAELFAEAMEPSGAVGASVAVVGGRGGAGATTLAAALAVGATRQGRRTLLVDGDPLGGGVDLVFGGEGTPGLRWPDLAATRGRVPAAALSGALPRMAELSVLSWDRGDTCAVPTAAMQAVLAAGRRSADLLVVDLPRQLDDCVRLVVGTVDVVLLVVPAEVRAAAAATRVAAALTSLCSDLRVVVRGPAPSGLSGADVAGALNLPLAGYVKAEPGLDLALERGEPPGSRNGPLAQLCGRLLSDLLSSPQRAA